MLAARTSIARARCVGALSHHGVIFQEGGSLMNRNVKSSSVLFTQRQPSHDPAAGYKMKSTAAVPSKCPVTGSSATTENSPPVLQKVPVLPLFGSILHTSKIPSLKNPFIFWPEMNKRYGEFYSFGLPGLGKSDIYGTVYVISDPQEMLKIVRSGGKYPSGLSEGMWPSVRWSRETKWASFEDGKEGIGGRGESWRNYRQFMQTDLLSPSSARGYVPCIIEAAELASKGAPSWKDDLNFYCNHVAFDMFASMMLGELCQTADPNTPTDPENQKFVKGALVGLSTMVQMTRIPYEKFMSEQLGLKTKMYMKFEGAWNDAWEVGMKKIEDFTERKAQGQLSEAESVSYLSRAIDRQAEEGSTVSLREAQEIVFSGLGAAVDTTASKIAWNLLHVARLPDVQEKLYQEISAAVAENGTGRLNVDMFNASTTPYLHAVIRESHRLTPVAPVNLIKEIGEDGISINGVPLPKGSTVCFDSISRGYDPEFVENPEEFIPERWLPEAVEQRKGTPKEIIDHPFYKEPFGQGPRKCPGSRVALNETKVMISQLLLDWKITSPVSSLDDVEREQQTTYICILPELQFEPRAN